MVKVLEKKKKDELGRKKSTMENVLHEYRLANFAMMIINLLLDG